MTHASLHDMMAQDPKAKALAKLRQLKDAHDAAKEQYEQQLIDWVAHARSAGANWSEIGAAIDMERANATRKFLPHLDTQTVVRPKD